MRRTHFMVCASIIKALTSESMSLNGVVMHMNLNRRLARLCISELVTSQFVSVEGVGAVRYQATEKGVDWCNRYSAVIAELRRI